MTNTNLYIDLPAALVLDLAKSYEKWTGKPLLGPSTPFGVEHLHGAEVAILAHDGAADPRFVYANLSAMRLFKLDWADIIGMPSRLSAEPDLREARAALLQRVARDGYVEDYTGVRIASDGSRFRIEQATVWNVLDQAGRLCGQAALIRQWTPLPRD